VTEMHISVLSRTFEAAVAGRRLCIFVSVNKAHALTILHVSFAWGYITSQFCLAYIL
jgi:hypothetical protein